MMPDLEVHKISLAEEKDGDQVLEACWIEPIKTRIRMAGLSKFGDKLYTQFEPAFSESSPNERVYNMRGHEVLNGVQAATSKRTGCRQENSNPNNYFKIWRRPLKKRSNLKSVLHSVRCCIAGAQPRAGCDLRSSGPYSASNVLFHFYS